MYKNIRDAFAFIYFVNFTMQKRKTSITLGNPTTLQTSLPLLYALYYAPAEIICQPEFRKIF